MTEIRRGASARCKEKGCMGKPKKLIQATTFKGSICEQCFCVHEYEKVETLEQEIGTNDGIVKEKESNAVVKDPKQTVIKKVKKKTVKQTGLSFEE